MHGHIQTDVGSQISNNGLVAEVVEFSPLVPSPGFNADAARCVRPTTDSSAISEHALGTASAAQCSRHGEVHHHRRENSPQVTCQQSCSSRKRLNHLRWSSPVFSAGNVLCWREISHDRDDSERSLVHAELAKLVGKTGASFGVFSEFTLRWRAALLLYPS